MKNLYLGQRLGQHILNRELIPNPINLNFGQRTRGQKAFELSNHLGNVLAVVSDRKIGIDTNTDDIVDNYDSEVIRAQDYYPFGLEMPGRTYENPNFSSNYRYGFNDD